jgi:hypothetical protein
MATRNLNKPTQYEKKSSQLRTWEAAKEGEIKASERGDQQQ